MNLVVALKYAIKVRASAADYHKAFDRLAADPKAEQAANEKTLVPTEFFADHLRSEGHHPQADLIQQAMAHSKQQGEPVVYSEQIAKFPPHHREVLEGLGQGDFHLVLGKPNSDYTNAALYQRSHTDPSKVFGWSDTIEGNPDEVKEEVERFQRAGVPVELAIGPQNKDYDKWAKHFGLSGHSEEPEQYAAKAETKAPALTDLIADPKADHNFLTAVQAQYAEGTPEWEALETARWNSQGVGDDRYARNARLFAPQRPTPEQLEEGAAHSRRHFLIERLASAAAQAAESGDEEGHQAATDVLRALGGELHGPAAGEQVPHHPHYYDTEESVFADSPVRVLRQPVTYNGVLAYKGQAEEAKDKHSTLERALKYVQETHADFLNRILEDGGHTTPQLVYADWLEETQGKSGLAAAIRKHTEEHQYGPDLLTGGRLHFWPAGGVERLFDTDPNPTTFNYHPQSGLIVQQHQSELPSNTVVWRTAASPEAEEIAKQMHKEGAVPVDMPEGWAAHKDPVLKSVNPTYGEPADPVSEHFSAAEKPLRYSAVPEHEVHEDYAPNGVAPRIGHTLKQLAQEDSTTGALAEGILRTGDHSILPILADRLEETEHPLASAFDWRHAPRAIRIDRALHRQINSRQVRHPDGHRVPLTAGWVLADMQDGVQRPAFSRRKALLAARLAVPDATTEDLLHSLFRLMDHREVADTAPELVQPVADHTKALTAARLQKLRQRAGNPYQYADTRQTNKQVYGSWRAPAGGMVVQQSPLAVTGQWAEGGEFVNDLQKLASQPVDYKQKPKKRLTVEYLRQHFRKRRKAKGVAGVQVIDDTAGEGDAGAEAGTE